MNAAEFDSGTLRDILTLRAVPGVGDVRLRALLEQHGSPAAALSALAREHPDAVAKVRSAAGRARIEHALRSITGAGDVDVLPIGDARYPQRLLELRDPPPLLFARGDLTLAERTMVAIVGTRVNTEYGEDVARMIADAVARAGAVVLSGLAHGIDRYAHESALDAGGATIAVIGSGIDVAYPQQHAALQDRIGRDGLILSEFLPGEPALRHHFPRRNRIIAALASAVVVVEAPHRSGALITASQALDLGREILAVPGPISRRTSEGTNALLRDGAGIVCEPADVLLAVGLTAGEGGQLALRAARRAAGERPMEPASARHNPIETHPTDAPGFDAVPHAGTGHPDAPTSAFSRIRHALGPEPLHADELAIRAGVSGAAAVAALLELELTGLARQYAGMRFGIVTPDAPVGRGRRGGR